MRKGNPHSPGCRNGVSRYGRHGYPLSPNKYPRSGSEREMFAQDENVKFNKNKYTVKLPLLKCFKNYSVSTVPNNDMVIVM